MGNRIVFISKRSVVSFADRNLEDAIKIENVTKLNIGYRLIYLEYKEVIDKDIVDGYDENGMHYTEEVPIYATRIRAFGREEFNTLVISDDDAFAIYPLKGDLFHKVNL